MEEQLRETMRLCICCELCFEPYGNSSSNDRQARVLKCGHSFCERCLKALFRSSSSTRCPSCRAQLFALTVDELPRNYGLEGISSLLAPFLQSGSILEIDALLKPPAANTCSPATASSLLSALSTEATELTAAQEVLERPRTPELSIDELAMQQARVALEQRRRAALASQAAAAAPLPSPPAGLPFPTALPAGDVEAAVVDWVRAQGRPVPLVRVCNYLADHRLWPPAQLATMLRQQQELRAAAEQQRSVYGASRQFVVDAAALRTPSPALLKNFLLSRGAMNNHNAGTHSCPTRAQGSSSSLSESRPGASLHTEIGRHSLAECLCAGGPDCSAGNDALSKRRQLAAVEPAAYIPPSLRDGAGGRVAAALPSAAGGYRNGAGGRSFGDDADDGYDDDDAYTERLVRQGRGKGGRRR